MRRFSLEEWIVLALQYAKTSRVGLAFCTFWVGSYAGLHQWPFLSPLLFITVLEALSSEFCTRCQWELLYSDYLSVILKMRKTCKKNWKKWKRGNPGKGSSDKYKKCKYPGQWAKSSNTMSLQRLCIMSLQYTLFIRTSHPVKNHKTKSDVVIKKLSYVKVYE